MSYIKQYFDDAITVMCDLDNRDFDYLYGVKIAAADGLTYEIDDYIDASDGLYVCCILTASDGVEKYAIMPEAAFIDIVMNAAADAITFPDYSEFID